MKDERELGISINLRNKGCIFLFYKYWSRTYNPTLTKLFLLNEHILYMYFTFHIIVIMNDIDALYLLFYTAVHSDSIYSKKICPKLEVRILNFVCKIKIQ